MRSEELIGTYLAEKQRFDGDPRATIVGEVSTRVNGHVERLAVIGPDWDGEPTIGGTYRFFGQWSEYTNRHSGRKSQQFKYTTLTESTPHNKLGIVTYLKKVDGIGDVLAARIYETLGSEAIEMIRERPAEAVKQVVGLTHALATAAQQQFLADAATEHVTIDLMELLTGRGFRKTLIREAVKAWGVRAPHIIRQNPYQLMRFSGVGFKLADALYLHLKLPPQRLKRQALCAWHALRTSGSGQTWHHVQVARQAITNTIGGAEVNVEKAIRLALRGGLMEAIHTDGLSGPIDPLNGQTCWLADGRSAMQERLVARYTTEALAERDVT